MAGSGQARIGIVVIGRNEGERLRRCLRSLPVAAQRIYVDSESTDGSATWARSQGVEVIELTAPPKHTAARGRNAGLRHLLAEHSGLAFVQFVDGDCEVHPDWLDTAAAALDADDRLGAVFGRRRERFPERSIYNALCDDEWNVPVGAALTCGGDVMCRIEAVAAIQGYDESMIAGEDPDMSTRLRAAGWGIERIDAEMTLHDAAILRFGQWWKRTRRAGHAFAELAHRHPDAAPGWPGKCRSIMIWGMAIPAATLLALAGGLIVHPVGLALAAGLLLLWPLNVARLLRARRDLPARVARANAVLLMLGKIPEALGLAEYHVGRLMGRQAQLIEYKGPDAG